MNTTERGLRTSSTLAPPRPLRLRRGGALRLILRPRAAAALLVALAAESDMRRYAAGVMIRACAECHEPRRWRPWP